MSAVTKCPAPLATTIIERPHAMCGRELRATGPFASVRSYPLTRCLSPLRRFGIRTPEQQPTVELTLTTAGLSAISLRDELASNRSVGGSYTVVQPSTRLRGQDPSILIAAISLGGGSLAALITGLFQIVNARKDASVSVAGPIVRVEVKGPVSKHRVDAIIDQVQDLEARYLKAYRESIASSPHEAASDALSRYDD